jgi:uracil-DNA glycosylase family 4
MTELATQETSRRHPLAACETCPLNTPEYGFVPSTGPDRALIALVGQNPGRNEIKYNKPFIGPSGRLLDKVLEAYHLDRSQMFITNACLCTSRDNPSFTPPPLAVAACRPRLMTELRQHGVETVMTLGNTATQSILRTKTGITSLRVGPYRETDDLPGVRVIPTFHPAACLRSSASFPSMANDFQKIITKPVPWEEPKTVVLDTERGALRALKLLRVKYHKVVVDIEVAIDKEKSFDHPNRFGILCIGVCVQMGIGIVFGEEACKSKAVLTEMAAWFKESELIFQNGKFDIGGLHPLGFLDLKIGQDTMFKSYVLDERSGIHGLKYNAVEKLGTPRYDEELSLYIPKGGNYGHIPRDVLYRYNAYDVVATWALDELFDSELDREDAQRLDPIRPRADGEWWGLRRLHDFLCEAATGFVYTELNGFAVDLAYNRELQKEYKAEIANLERIMFKIVGPFNPRSPMQVKAVLHDLKVEIPKKKNAKGVMAETTDAEALQMMLDALKSRRTNRRPVLQARVVQSPSNSIGPEAVEVDTQDQAITFLETMLKHRKASKMDGTYVSGLRKFVYRGRVYPTIMLHSTNTGRLSQKRPSLQVIPRGDKLRRQYKVAKDDHVLIECDYGQLELRVLTWLAQDEYFAEIFRDPSRDLFDELIPVIKPERSYRQQLSKKDRRNVIKCFVYGLAYGREAKSIAEELDIPLREAQMMLRDFFSVIPNIVAFREKVKKMALQGQDLITPFGRRRRFSLITDENIKEIQNEACAFFPQSIGSDICVSANNVLRPELKGIAWCRNTIHDALYYETHQDNVEYVGRLMQQRMMESAVRVVGDYVPFKVDCEVGRNWGDMVKLEEWLEGKRPYSCAVELWKPPMFREAA